VLSDQAVNAQRWADVKSVFSQALQQPAAERLRWLDSLGLTDLEIVAEVRRLLSQTDEECSLLRDPTGLFVERPGATGRTLMFEPGQVVGGRFQVQTFLGAGGMGEVYAAHDDEVSTLVAIKVLRAEYSRQPAFIHRLKREVQLARRLTHPNLCPVYDLHTISVASGETVAISMQFLPGITLRHRLSAAQLDFEEALTLLTEIAAGIDAAHSAGILHRDLKSANIMLVEDGPTRRAVIMDFGLAREIETVAETQSLFGADAVVGTPAYMAPEQLMGKGATKATDIYSLGVIAFETLTRRLPFEGETTLAVALRRLQERAPSPRRYRPEIPLGCERAILACLVGRRLCSPGARNWQCWPTGSTWTARRPDIDTGRLRGGNCLLVAEAASAEPASHRQYETR
jgi:serine/threonine protein kinase